MKISSINLSLFILLSKAKAAAAGSVRGSREQAFTVDGELDNDGGGFKPIRFLSERRRLLPHEGVMRTLIIRVTDSEGNQPITDARRESDTWFGTHNLTLAGNLNSLSSIYDQCSGGKILFVPAMGANVIDGVLDITMDQSLDGLHISDCISLVRNKFNALNAELNIEFESYSMIMPVGVKGSGGLARQGGNHQIYAGGADRSLELVVHEFGHNFGLHHSGLPDAGGYDDNSCMMGCCAGAQQMCFNAAKSYYLGWYSDPGKEGYENLSHFDTPGEWWKGKLVGVDDYLNGVYNEDHHRVVTRMSGGLYMMFNRKKGVNSGVKAYGDEVVIVQQWGEGGKSNVLGTLDEENKSFIYSDREHYDFDVVVKLCELFYAPVVTGSQINGGTASQSSTAAGAEASRAFDGNLDQSWQAGSVTHTDGEEDDPWWKLTLDSPEDIEHIRIYNRGDCCGSRLNNAIVELVNASGQLIYSHNLGNAVSVRELFLGNVHRNVKEVTIKLLGNKILSLAEVQLFRPFGEPRERMPDHAQVITYLTDGTMDIDCYTTESPTVTTLPSLAPSVTFQPSVYRAIPKEVTLLRDVTLCILQVNPDNHPDRFKCLLQPTAPNSEPGGHDNAPVLLRGHDGCLLAVKPVTWAWGGSSFIFQSDADLAAINACFTPGTLISELGPTATPSSAPSIKIIPTTPSPSSAPTIQIVPETPSPSSAPTIEIITATPTSSNAPSVEITQNDVILLRDDRSCIFQHNPSNHPDRFKCMIKPTIVSSEPGGYDNAPIAMQGQGGCLITVQPVTWAWDGNAFIFQSDADLEAINACFTPGTLIKKSKPTGTPSAAPSVEIIPRDVILLRDDRSCIFQHNPSNHPDRFKCMLEPTIVSSEPGGYGNAPITLRGLDGCVITLEPVTWAWDGNAFIFQSDADLEAINACFAPGTLISENGAMTSEIFS